MKNSDRDVKSGVFLLISPLWPVNGYKNLEQDFGMLYNPLTFLPHAKKIYITPPGTFPKNPCSIVNSFQ